MTSFPWQIGRIRLPVFSTLSPGLNTIPLPEMHSGVGISRTKGIAWRNPGYSFLSHPYVVHAFSMVRERIEDLERLPGKTEVIADHSQCHWV